MSHLKLEYKYVEFCYHCIIAEHVNFKSYIFLRDVPNYNHAKTLLFFKIFKAN